MYYGSSAMAIDFMARKHGYVAVDVEPGLDLFLVRSDLWGRRNVPDIAKLSSDLSTFIERRHPCRSVGVVPFWTLWCIKIARCLLLVIKLTCLRRLRGLAGLCYNQEDSSAYYQSRKVRPCHHLFSHLYEETCQAYPKSNGVLFTGSKHVHVHVHVHVVVV